jgi:hypothetical protein
MSGDSAGRAARDAADALHAPGFPAAAPHATRDTAQKSPLQDQRAARCHARATSKPRSQRGARQLRTPVATPPTARMPRIWNSIVSRWRLACARPPSCPNWMHTSIRLPASLGTATVARLLTSSASVATVRHCARARAARLSAAVLAAPAPLLLCRRRAFRQHGRAEGLWLVWLGAAANARPATSSISRDHCRALYALAA